MAAQSQVEAISDDINQGICGNLYDLNLRMLLEEYRYQILQRELGDFDSRRHSDDTAGLSCPLAHRFLGYLRCLQQCLSVVIELRSYLGHAKSARRPVEQRHAQSALEVSHPIAQGGLRQAQRS